MSDLESILNKISSEISNKEEECYNCGGKGFVGRPCEVCGKIREVKKVDKIKKYNNKIIPEFYHDVTWSRGELLKDKRNNSYLDEFINELEKITLSIKNGILPKNSYLIVAPPFYGKKTWAYTCMRYAIDKGYKVAPLLDTQEYKRLVVLGSEKPRYELYNSIDIDKYLTSDLVVLSVVKDQYLTEAFASILSILDKRDRLGKPTIIISEFDVRTISLRDYTKSFQRYIEYGSTRPSNKCPKLIEYREE